MAVGKEVRGPLWVDGRFTVRVRGPGPEPGRVIRVRRPFALIGQIPGADIRIDDPAVDGRHAFLLLDRRGIFGVDLLTRTGTRFAGAASASAWLGAGDVLEVAGRRVELLQLRVDGTPIDPPLANVDLLADADASGLVELTLEPLDSTGPPWMLGSALAFVGRGEACAIRIENASASRTHCLSPRMANGSLRDRPPRPPDAGQRATRRRRLDAPRRRRPVHRPGPLWHPGGSNAHINSNIESNSRSTRPGRTQAEALPVVPSRLADAYQGSRELALGPRETVVAMLLGAAESGRDTSSHEILEQ